MFILTVLFCAACSSAHAEKLALVIGIDKYDRLTPLQKAVGDARTMAQTFRETGYRVRLLENLRRDEFWREWTAFQAQVKEGDEIAFVFSGHGIEIEGSNYLLARDAPDPDRGERVIREDALKVSALLDDLRSQKPRVTLAILDACRNNPYSARGTRSVGGTRGLARIDPPEGAFVMYSAGVGEEALDRLSDQEIETNSVYTRNLIPLLKTPGLRIQDVALQVRDEVRATAATVHHRQNPAYYDELRGGFCLAGCAEGGTTTVPRTNQAKKEPPVIAPAAAAPPPPTPPTRAECDSNNPALSCLWRN